MTLNDILTAMRAGEADSRHADALEVIIHDMRNEMTTNYGDLDKCRKLLGLEGDGLVFPSLEKHLHFWNYHKGENEQTSRATIGL